MTKHIRSPQGAIHDVPDDHFSVAMAEAGEGGYRFARRSEIREMYREHGVEVTPEMEEEFGLSARPKVAESVEPETTESKTETKSGAETKTTNASSSSKGTAKS